MTVVKPSYIWLTSRRFGNSGWMMKTNVKRKNYYLDERKIKRAKTILKADTETQAIDAALDLVVFRKEILESLGKVAGKGGVEKIF